MEIATEVQQQQLPSPIVIEIDQMAIVECDTETSMLDTDMDGFDESQTEMSRLVNVNDTDTEQRNELQLLGSHSDYTTHRRIRSTHTLRNHQSSENRSALQPRLFDDSITDESVDTRQHRDKKIIMSPRSQRRLQRRRRQAHDDGGDSPKRSSSSADNKTEQVIAQGWTRRIASRMKQIKIESEYLSTAHALAGYHFHKRQTLLALPAIITPAVCSPVVALLASSEQHCSQPSTFVAPSALLGTFSLALTGALTTIITMFRYGDRSRDHHTFAAKYADLVTTINTEMARSRRFRRNVDQFLVEIQLKFDQYGSAEPVIPQSIQTVARKTIVNVKESTMVLGTPMI